jgi:hypothetical protein
MPSELWAAAERALVDGDAETLERLLREHGTMLRAGPVQSSWWGGLAPRYTETDARTIIAREHHFENWDQFAAYAAELKNPGSPIARFEAAVDAIITGDLPTFEQLLRTTPDLIRQRSTRTHHSMLLHYVGANGVEGFRQRTPKNAVRVAEVLLDAGADIDALAGMYGGYQTLGLVATSIHPVTAGVQQELMSYLLDRGASVGDGGNAAWASLINACHANGRPAAAEFLAARRPDALDLEAAAGVGRLDIVQSFFEPDGRLKSTATLAQMKDGLAWACEYGRTAVVEFLLDRGLDAGTTLPRPHGQTGLHWAAFNAHVDAVEALLKRHAPVDARDRTFDATPLGWALHAWQTAPMDAARKEHYYRTVGLLVGAGATVEPAWITDELQADARMRAALRLT